MQERAPVAHVQVRPPGLEVTVYSVIVAPPAEAGAVHDTTLWVSAALVAVTLIGAPGVVLGVTALVTDVPLIPLAFVAVTTNV